MSFRKPTTPNAHSVRTAPSTTPAGNPPSYLTDRSTTPHGLPPQLTFGSSFNPANNTFARKNNSFEVPDENGRGYSDDDAEGEVDEDLDETGLPPDQSFMSSIPPSSPRGLKRSRDGRVVEKRTYPLAAAAQGFIGKKAAPLKETDEVIIKSEDILGELDAKVQRQPAEVDKSIITATAQLTKLWRKDAAPATKSGSIGPRAKDGFTRANYIATLLLALHCPHTDKPGKALVRGFRSSGPVQANVPVPRALLDWLETYHKPWADDYDSIRDFEPSPSAHESFWDAVYANALRGKLDKVVQLLRSAGLEHAITARDDFEDDDAHYSGHQLANAKVMMERCAHTIQNCPGLQSNDWDVKDHDWKIFRHNVQIGLNELFHEAEGDGSRFAQSSNNVFGESDAQSPGRFSVATRRAMSKIPWSIYENLRLLYGLLLGSPEEIMMVSQDWLEASLYSTIWWDGNDEHTSDPNLSKSSFRKSNTQKPRPVDVNPLESYKDKLASEFAEVTQDPEDAVFLVQTIDPVQVALGCVLEGSVGAVISFLRMWSLPITVAIVEIAALGRWIPLVRPRSSGGVADMNFSKEDLLVLSAGPRTPPSPDSIDRDDVLSDYAELLGSTDQILDKEGWEVAVAVLSRLDQTSDAGQKILDLLDRLDLYNEIRVDKVLGVCDAFGLSEQRGSIAERFADSLAEKGESHGATLIYYARAHATGKLKAHIEVLTSTCLLHSAALPGYRHMDAKLRSLLSKDRAALKELAVSDMEAAALLSSYLSGYAMLRKFYEVRDQDTLIAEGIAVDEPLKSLERRRLAASTLFAVIKSSADCIAGGLFDPAVEAVVSVDGLLTLFGESLPLLGQDRRLFPRHHVFALLALLEDFVAAPSRLRENAASLLTASLAAYKDAARPAPAAAAKKSAPAPPDLSASSSWDMLASVTAQSPGVGQTRRAWDWRRGLLGMGEAEPDGATVLGLFREALVREVAAGWGGKIHW